MKNTSGRMAVMLALTLGLLANVFYSADASAKKEKVQFPFITNVKNVSSDSSFRISVDFEYKDIWVDSTILDQECTISGCMFGVGILGYSPAYGWQASNQLLNWNIL